MTAPGARVPGKQPPQVQDRNREIVAERLGWPDGALEACRKTEARAPGWYCWWTPAPWPDPGFRPAYGATLIFRATSDPTVYGRTPGDLAVRISEAIAWRAGEAASGA